MSVYTYESSRGRRGEAHQPHQSVAIYDSKILRVSPALRLKCASHSLRLTRARPTRTRSSRVITAPLLRARVFESAQFSRRTPARSEHDARPHETECCRCCAVGSDAPLATTPIASSFLERTARRSVVRRHFPERAPTHDRRSKR